jgi:predicted dehydrogenase
MSDHLSDRVWLIGAGGMARAHAKVLRAMGRSFRVISRGETSAGAFAEDTGMPVTTGGLAKWLADAPDRAECAIVAVPVPALAETAISLIRFGVPRILLEKPGGIDAAEIEMVAAAAREAGVAVLVAYNRRFFASVARARQLLEEDGGAVSFAFEFTELADVVAQSAHADGVKRNWFLANSSHVVDLAFFLGGAPKHLYSLSAGSLPWHERAERFAGCGVSQTGALFSYIADWGSAGRWGVEIMTRQRRLILRPLESLGVQIKGRFPVDAVELDDALDRDFKPGLYRQAEAFLGAPEKSPLIDIHEHAARVRDVFLPMLSGQSRG